MKITILGCGSSGGVPLIGNVWGACDPANQRNRRLRPSILVEEGGVALLADTSPDMREQVLACNLQKLTAVLYTHAHADHSHGIDNLRSVNWLTQKPVPIYGDEETIGKLKNRFDYIFRNPASIDNFHVPRVQPFVIEGPLNFGSVKVTPFRQKHGTTHSLGYRFNDFAYSTDVNGLNEEAFAVLKGIKVWVVDGIREKPHPSHAHIGQTLEWIKKIGPERAYLTHMDQSVDYAALAAKLPRGVWPAHDGLVIEC